MTQFKTFLLQVGKYLSANQWNQLVKSLQNLFEATIPQSLIEEKERWVENSAANQEGRSSNASNKGEND